MSSRFTLFPFTHTSFAFTLVTLRPIPCDFCGVCTKCVCVHVPFRFCRCERVCIGICVCVCVHRGYWWLPDSLLDSLQAVGWQGVRGCSWKRKSGTRLHPAARQAVLLSDGQSWFVIGSQLLRLETVSVGRPVPQAHTAGGHQPSGALERLSLKSFAYWENVL